jgi:ferritin
MCKVADEEDDFVTREFLNWFLNEQLMEENAVSEIHAKAIKLERTGGLYAAMDDDFTKMDH